MFFVFQLEHKKTTTNGFINNPSFDWLPEGARRALQLKHAQGIVPYLIHFYCGGSYVHKCELHTNMQ